MQTSNEISKIRRRAAFEYMLLQAHNTCHTLLETPEGQERFMEVAEQIMNKIKEQIYIQTVLNLVNKKSPLYLTLEPKTSRTHTQSKHANTQQRLSSSDGRIQKHEKRLLSSEKGKRKPRESMVYGNHVYPRRERHSSEDKGGR